MHNIWSSGVTHVYLSTDYLDLARKQWWWLVLEVEWIARSTVDRSFASVSLTQFNTYLTRTMSDSSVFTPCFFGSYSAIIGRIGVLWKTKNRQLVQYFICSIISLFFRGTSTRYWCIWDGFEKNRDLFKTYPIDINTSWKSRISNKSFRDSRRESRKFVFDILHFHELLMSIEHLDVNDIWVSYCKQS